MQRLPASICSLKAVNNIITTLKDKRDDQSIISRTMPSTQVILQSHTNIFSMHVHDRNNNNTNIVFITVLKIQLQYFQIKRLIIKFCSQKIHGNKSVSMIVTYRASKAQLYIQ